MLRHNSRNGFFKFLIYAVFLKILTKKYLKMLKNWFFGKKWPFFFVKIFKKYCLIQKFEKKTIPRVVS